MILLIEDREERQKNLLEDAQIDLDAYSDILHNAVKDKYEQFVKEIKKNSFSLDAYDVIMCHKSAFDDENIAILQKIEDHCSDTEKPLVLFSGGLDANHYENDGFKKLELNSKLFYSENLALFLDDYRESKHNILTLSYGKYWQLNILLKIFEKTNLEIEKGEALPFDKFKTNTDYRLLDDLEIKLYEPKVEGRKILDQEMKKFANNLEHYIEKVITS